MFTFTKRLLLILGLVFCLITGYSQRVTVATQNFDGGGSQTTFTATPVGSWVNDAAYFAGGSNSIHADVPLSFNDSVYLTSDVIDISPATFPPQGLSYAKLRFKHICKISPMDTVKVQYRLDVPGDIWKELDASSYEGTATNYGTRGFNASSYATWDAADSTILPDNATWWKEEVFDLSNLVAYERFQIRFFIKRGNTLGSNVSYGWNIDDITVIADNQEMKDPVISFAGNPPSDSVCTVGPFTIKANIVSATTSPLMPTYLVWQQTINGVVTLDSALMTLVSGVWQATLPQMLYGSSVSYHITARDTATNEKTISGTYVIACGASSGYTIIGTGTNNNYLTPMNPWYTHSWTRQLYLAGEIQPGGSGGLITEMAWYWNASAVRNFTNQACYFQLVDDIDLNTIGTAYYDPASAPNTTLVWSGTYTTISSPGWVNQVLPQSYNLPAGKNLLIHWIYQYGTYTSTSDVFAHTNVGANMATYQYGFGSFNSSAGYHTYDRPNLRLGILPNGPEYLNSAGLAELNIPSTIDACDSFPIIVKVKNRGITDLTNAVLNYSINGGATTSKAWTGFLPWDFETLDTLGWAKGVAGSTNSLKTWISMPNGVADSTNWDDTLTKTFLGKSDMEVAWVTTPTNLVNSTGPHAITVSVSSATGLTFPAPQLSVRVKDSLGNLVNTYNIPLYNITGSGNNYTAYLQNIAHKDTAYYSFSIQDYCGNIVSLSERYTIVSLSPSVSVGYSSNSDSIVAGGGTSVLSSGDHYNFPFDEYWSNGWCRLLYMHNEIDGTNNYLSISKIAFRYISSSGQTCNNVSFYAKATSSTSLAPTSTLIDPIADGATLIWGPATATCTSGDTLWIIELPSPIVLAPNMNLLVYCINQDGVWASNSSGKWECSAFSPERATGYNADSPNPLNIGATNGYLTVYRPNLKVNFYPSIGSVIDSNSVKMEKIISPITSSTGTNNITVVIRNIGITELDTCDIYYSINGGTPVHYGWSGHLKWGFVDTIVLNTYTVVAGVSANLTTWVSMPNNLIDSKTEDDTLSVFIAGCGGDMYGQKTIGATGDFLSFADAKARIFICGLNGDLELAFQTSLTPYTEVFNFTDLTPASLNGHRLTLTSLSGNAADVVWQSPSGQPACIFGENENIYIKNITLDATLGTHGILLNNVVDNVEINGCIIKANPTSTGDGSGNGIHYVGVAKPMGNLRILNNTITGGGIGFRTANNGSTTDAAASTKWITFVGNTVTGWYSHGIYGWERSRWDSIAYNTFTPRAITDNTTYGIRMAWDNHIKYIMGNKFTFTNNAGTRIMLELYGGVNGTATGATSSVLLINNEIRDLGTTGNFRAINIDQANIKAYHNSIYSTSSNTNELFYIGLLNSPYHCELKNNILACFSPTGSNYCIRVANTSYAMPAMCDIDYNCYYSANPASIAYIGSTIGTLSAIKTATTQDNNSKDVQPAFINPANGLSLVHGANVFCPILPDVTVDINNTARISPTSMGCYQPNVPLANGALMEIVGLKEGNFNGQADTLYVKIMNQGSAPLTSVNLGYSQNGTLKNGNVNRTLNLSLGEDTVIAVGSFVYVPNNNVFEVWINNINGNPTADQNSADDTLSTETWICVGPYNGTITIGNTGTFQNIAEALTALKLCGINGDLTVALMPGTYNTDLDLSNSAAILGTHKLTITSSTSTASQVTLTGPIYFNNTQNIEINNITIGDYTKKLNNIWFQGASNSITIQNCRLLADTTGIGKADVARIYKDANTGLANNVTIKNNLLEGGYQAIYFVAGTGTTAYAQHLVIDSNTILRQNALPVNIQYAQLDKMSYNTITSRYTNSSWTDGAALALNNCTGDVIGNRIKKVASGNGWGISLNEYNIRNFPAGDTALIANNEIILLSTTSCDSRGLIVETGGANCFMINNSVYISGGGSGNRGVYVRGNFYGKFQNNIIYMASTSATAMYISSSSQAAYTQFGYNCYYSPTNIGNNGGTLAQWIVGYPTDATAIVFQPDFADPTVSLELNTYADTLLAPLYVDVLQDITGLPRMGATARGAYAQPLQGQDASLISITPWNANCIENQTININVDVLNAGAVPIANLSLGWSLNGVVQIPNISHTFSTPLASASRANIPVSSFTVTGSDTFDIVVWVASVNLEADTINRNDTVRATTTVVPLVEWVAPLVDDTVNLYAFDVYAKIQTMSGAPLSQPKIIWTTYINGHIITDSVDMTLENSLVWKGTITSYYSSDVVYYLTVSDGINTKTITDSTYVLFAFAPPDTLILGTGTSVNYQNPYYSTWDYGASRNIVRHWELSPTNKKIVVSEIAFQSAATGTVDNISFFVQAVPDSILTSCAYVDPIVAGATQVWGPATITTANTWYNIVFATPFELPSDMNLLIYCNNQDGSWGSSTGWYYTTQSINTSSYLWNDDYWPPTGAAGCVVGNQRPNMKIVLQPISELYAGNNLLLESPTPVTPLLQTCAPDYQPISVVLTNAGENDYDFANDAVSVTVLATSPLGVIDTFTVMLNSGLLESGISDTIVLEPSYRTSGAGTYSFMAYVSSPIDNVIYDDTIRYSYLSYRTQFPLDVNFSTGIVSDLAVSAVNTPNQWRLTVQGVDADSTIISADSMLVFTGSKGSITRLITRQLDIANAYQPKLTLWYYQDTGNAKDYTSIYITTDGGATYTLLQTLRRGNPALVLPEWIPYVIDLSAYQNGQCIYLMFESMKMSLTGGAQYIDRIRLDAKQDMAVGAILVDSISACDLNNKSIKVVLSNTTSQGINFVNYPTALHVNISGAINQSLTIPFTSGELAGMNDDTLDIWTGNITSGTYQITAFIESVDEMLSNDTMIMNFTIDPKLHVSAVNNTTLGTYCVLPNTQLEQDIVVYNTGNLDLEDIVVKMEISNTSGAITETVLDTIAGILSGGNSVSHKMSNTYAVPVASYYNVKVTAYPLCNSAITSDTTLVECADLDDIELVSIEQPLSSAIDTFGRSQNIVVKVRNNNPDNDAANVKLHAEVIANGGVVSTIAGTINSIVAGSDVNYSFTTSYTIPREVSYTLKVYVESQDKIASNDTLLVNRTAADTLPIVDDILPIGKDGISLSQNIPNPASNTTKVEYSLPHDGKAVFNIYTTAGQVIYTQSVDAIVGKNNIIFDLNGLSSGIYFYSMEFEGQKLVRKMSVK